MSTLHKCNWCKETIVNKLDERMVKKNGVTEYYHYNFYKDCLSDKIQAIVAARKLLEQEDW